ncbi:NAD(P)-dependent dehydrogenase (short-subunit alcohol dehydrogenase family) [Amaricoccus macauensis]|uniref:NAD(P)-dependent dehydrogenase (Short-subunit alcohol dehydrogenase family) n=1 Tax=Amaricoccus macauensis TaxID=57001 RepID=A0A840SMV7_9RHOB|nr:NAD(P)-dependent dehydrogenase (short-subunit alcohol dehydrogenase family) [Amaricoccus macauensis]
MSDAALVTGGAQRIGAVLCRKLASRGADVAIHCHASRDAAEALAAELCSTGVRAAVVVADLLDRTETAGLVAAASAALGRPLTVLVNNASIFEHDTIATATWESWDRHIGSNLRAPFELIQAFAAQAPKADIDAEGRPLARASVINMVDQRVLKLTPEFATYTIAKMGLWALTRTAAQGLAPHVRVNAIGPGPTLRGVRQSASHFADQKAATLLGRGSDPDEVATTLGYFLDAPGVTGQLICVDGGQHLAWQTPDVLGVE